MAITYRGSQKLSHQNIDDNFKYINDNTIEVTDTTGSAILPIFDGTNPNNNLVDGAFFYDGAANQFAFYSGSTKRSIVPRGYLGSIGDLDGGTGVTGYKGSQGAPGGQGVNGSIGVTGSPGYKGSKGYTGSIGNAGPPGPQGPTGYKGSKGANGPTGYKGSKGANAVLSSSYLQHSMANNVNFAYSDIGSTSPGANNNYYGVAVDSINSNVYIHTDRTSGVIPLRLNRQSTGNILAFARSNLSTDYNFTLYANMSSSKVLTFSNPTGLKTIYDAVASDYRIKENIEEVNTGELELINKLKVYSYKDIYDDEPSRQVRYGVLAHEMAEVYPHFIRGEKDAVDEQNKPIYQTVDYAGLMPSLTLALKELTEQIEELEKYIDNL